MKRAVVMLLILILCLSFAYAALECVHDCSGEECPICRVIAVFSTLFAVAAVCFVAVLCFALASFVPRFIKGRAGASTTPTELGVKLSN